jgi:NAD(P)H-hydrate epimerase
MVIDADALNIMGVYQELLLTVTAGSILTPHPKEFERIVDTWANDFERLEKQRKLSIDLKSVVILKGAYTSVTSPEGLVYFNSTGNPGMATGGTGDVLTGVLTALLAQGYSAIDAALIGVYVHGLAGDIGAREKGMDSLIASDLVDCLADAFLKVRS